MAAINAGIQVRRDTPIEALEFIRRADQAGVPVVWSTFGGSVPDGLGVYAAAAVTTRSVTFGTSVVPTYPRHPVVLAAQALTIEDLAPGRLRLGIGTSHRSTITGALGIEMGKPLDHLREYLTILRSLLWSGSVDHEGEYCRVHAALPEGTMPPRTPILISALRSNAFQLAGELADGAITWVCPIPYLVETAIPAMAQGASKVDRARPPIIAHVPVIISENRDVVRRLAHEQLGFYAQLPFYMSMFVAAGFPIGPGGSFPDELIDALVVSGSIDQITCRLEEIHAAGIDELLLAPTPVHDRNAEEDALFALVTNRA